MKKVLSRLFAVVATLCLFTACGNKAEDPFVAIGGEDLSQTVICPRQVLLQELDRDVDGLITCDTQYSFQLPEPLGYRGADYWRFYIHFDTVYKTDLLRYSVLGRTRYRDTVRRFCGEIILDSLSIVWTLDSLDDFFYRLARYTDIDYGAYLHGHYFFREDTTVHGAGLLQGRVIYSVIHEKGTLCYDPEGIDKTTAEDLLQSLAEASKPATPWWVIALKTVAYLIGLLLAGYGTSAAAQTLLIECVNV